MVRIPTHVNELLAALRGAGYAAYPVGGCVRDSLMGREPADWDLCTSALPEQTEAVLAGRRVLETGIRHGTVTVLTAGGPVEITTFRADGAYRDSRHPDSVTFVGRVEDDLARRDFTVNAMALGPDGDVIDPFSGRADLAAGLIRCVGEPDRRFGEDALRILRALRFASRLGFAIEPATAESLLKNRALLEAIAAERVFSELCGILAGPGVGRVLLTFAPVIFQIIPELAPEAGLDQRNPHHLHDVWTHSVLATAAAPPDPALRLTMLLHDIGKPETFFTDSSGVGHFYGHAQAGSAKADAILRRLRCDNATRERVCLLVAEHASPPPQTAKAMRRLLARLGPDTARQLLACWRADGADRPEAVRARLQAYAAGGDNAALFDETERLLDAALAQPAPCFGVKSLAIDGRDVMALGAPEGPAVGRTLTALLDAVLDGAVPNQREALLDRARALLAGDCNLPRTDV